MEARQNASRQGPSRPFVEMEVKLNSFEAQDCFKKAFQPTSWALYDLSVVLRFVSGEDAAAEVETAVEERIKGFQSELQAERARLQELLKSNGLDGQKVGFSNPRSLRAEVNCPKSGRYLQLIRDLDELMGVLTVLWVFGVLNDDQYRAGGKEWQRSVLRAGAHIQRLTRQGFKYQRRQEAAQVAQGSQEQVVPSEVAGQPVPDVGSDMAMAN